MAILDTDRLALRCLEARDAPFIVELLNEPDFIRFIGDRKIRDQRDALRYLQEGPQASYVANGFGLWLVERAADRVPLGICGLVKRPDLDDADLGFAFRADYGGLGYAREAAAGVVDFAFSTLGRPRLAAIVNPDNLRSIHLLQHLGFRFERMMRRSGETTDVRLYGLERVAR